MVVLADGKQLSSVQHSAVARGGEREQALAARSIEVQAGAGMVRVTVDGRGRIRRLDLAPEVFAGRDAELLADLVLGAVAEAQRRADDLAADDSAAAPAA